MSLQDLPPDPPAWALSAGLPAPRGGENFVVYVERLGLEPDDLLDGLDDRTAPLANIRLASRLLEAMPGAFNRYFRERRDSVLRSL